MKVVGHPQSLEAEAMAHNSEVNVVSLVYDVVSVPTGRVAELAVL
jgi:hypothetical protein